MSTNRIRDIQLATTVDPDAWQQYKAAQTEFSQQCIARQEVFLRAYAQVGTIKAGCEAAQVSRNAADKWIAEDTHHFRERLQVAREVYTDTLEELMDQRLREPSGNRGSDLLLMFALKGNRPDKWRETVTIQDDAQSRAVLARLDQALREARQMRGSRWGAPRSALAPGDVILHQADAGHDDTSPSEPQSS